MAAQHRPGLSYRAKLFFAILGLTTISLGTVFFLTARHSREIVLSHIQSSVLSIAIAAADQIDVAAHESIQSESDATSEAYKKTVAALRKIRDLNRRDDLHTAFVYTMRKTASDPDRWVYVVDAEEPGEDRSPVGKEIVWDEQGTPDEEPLQLGPAYADNKFANDEYGAWLSAYAPILDATGTIVGMVGVDLAADDVVAHQSEIVRLGLAGLIAGLLAAAVLTSFLSKWASAPLSNITHALDKIGAGHLETRLPTTSNDEFATVSAAVNFMAKSLQERDALRGALSHMVSAETAKRLIADNKLPELRGERRTVTVLIGDITNIARVARTLPPEKLIDRLNEYFEAMVAVIFRHHGTIDRLVGHRLVAVFGAPYEDPDMELNAVRASIAMRDEAIRLNQEWGSADDQKICFGLSIHTGAAVLGNVGSSGNVAFTVVGESFDVACQISAEIRSNRCTPLASETTINKIREKFNIREVGEIYPAGSESLLRVFSINS